MRHARIWTLLILAAASAAGAEPMKREEVPGLLKPWISWVLYGSESELCPFLSGMGSRRCTWPGVLTLSLNKSGGRFEQTWRLDAEDWIILPGGARIVAISSDERSNERMLAAGADDALPKTHVKGYLSRLSKLK